MACSFPESTSYTGVARAGRASGQRREALQRDFGDLVIVRHRAERDRVRELARLAGFEWRRREAMKIQSRSADDAAHILPGQTLCRIDDLADASYHLALRRP
jgi:hypothetical protein